MVIKIEIQDKGGAFDPSEFRRKKTKTICELFKNGSTSGLK